MKKIILSMILVLISSNVAFGQADVITYQGKLNDGGFSANGLYDMSFRLFTTVEGIVQVGDDIDIADVAVVNGVFSVRLNFNSADAFNGQARFLDIRIRKLSDPGFTTLSPRQPITKAPQAIFANVADTAVTAQTATTAGTATSAQNTENVGGQSATSVANAVALTNAATSSEIGATIVRRDVSGDFSTRSINAAFITVSTITASSSVSAGLYNLNGQNLLRGRLANNNLSFGFNTGNPSNGISNTYLGSSAGLVNLADGNNNTFIGAFSGSSNERGQNNTFVGNLAGSSNQLTSRNTYMGSGAGRNAVQSNNAYFGFESGRENIQGTLNAFFGMNSGSQGNAGSRNAFFGASSGQVNEANLNSFFGSSSGSSTTTGEGNSFFGANVGRNNVTGGNNTLIGNSAEVSSGALTFATAIGSGAIVTQSNTIVLGRTQDKVVMSNLLLVNQLGSAGSTSLCRNTSNQISTCTAGNLSERSEAEFNAMKSEIEQQRLMIEALKALVCQSNKDADVCKEQ